ncbi:hypothetical protein [Candidatus Amarolinea dominans]|uniref:hypothetical protein n=1 Tax=Candidatus Amarolinea dominans TaxID=3140696 RepID=UPI0031CC8D58
MIDISIPAEPGQKAQPSHSLGIQLAGRIKAVFPAFGIVLFSAYEDRGGEVLELIQEGSRGSAYKLKGCQPAALRAALRGVIAGQVIVDPDDECPLLAEHLVQQLSPEDSPTLKPPSVCWANSPRASVRWRTGSPRRIAMKGLLNRSRLNRSRSKTTSVAFTISWG